MSRELDVQVAEKVMGWTEIRDKEIDDFDIYTDLVGKRPDGFVDGVPWFSTDIAAAWQVVEKMRMMWGKVDLRTVRYMWEFGWEGDGGIWGRATADTAPEAICRAALKAREGEDD